MFPLASTIDVDKLISIQLIAAPAVGWRAVAGTALAVSPVGALSRVSPPWCMSVQCQAQESPVQPKPGFRPPAQGEPTMATITFDRPTSRVQEASEELGFQQQINRLLARTKSPHGQPGQTLLPDIGSEPLWEMADGAARAPALPRGAVTEILSGNASTIDPAGDDGALALLVPLIRRLTREGKMVAIVDHNMNLHPPGLAAAGVDLKQLLILRPQRRADALWAAETCAKSCEIALTVLPASRLRDLDVRRLSLSAGEGKGVLVLLRPAREEGLSAPCALRLRVTRRSRGSISPSTILGGAGVPPASSPAYPSRLPEANSSQGARLCEPPVMNQGLEGRRDAEEEERTGVHPPRLVDRIVHPPTPAFRLEVLRTRGSGFPPPPITIGVNHESPLDLHLAPLPEHRPTGSRVTASSA